MDTPSTPQANRFRFRAWEHPTKSMAYSGDAPDIGFWKWVKYDSTTLRTETETVVMQSTGLLDKNGVEIYEGDIVKREMQHPEYGDSRNYGEWIDTIVYDEELACYSYKLNGPIHLHMTNYMTEEIIGNIYENPELLPSA